MGTQCRGPPIIGPLDVLGTGPKVYREVTHWTISEPNIVSSLKRYYPSGSPHMKFIYMQFYAQKK